MNILEKAGATNIYTVPFPHLVIQDAIDAGLCERLIREFPPLTVLSGGTAYGSNERLSYPAWDAVRDIRISPLWRAFVADHSTQDFFDRVVDALALDGFRGLRVGLRNRDSFDDSDVLINVQICANTPVVRTPSSVRAIHLDSPNKVFVGLFYLRSNDDDSSGADLELYGSAPHSGPVAIVPYRNNTCVFFANSVLALHAVSVRTVTSHPRLFVNIIAETRRPIFPMPSSHSLSSPVSRTGAIRSFILRVAQPLGFLAFRLPASLADRFDGSHRSSDRAVRQACVRARVSDIPILALGAGMKRYARLFFPMDHASIEAPYVHNTGIEEASRNCLIVFDSWDRAFVRESVGAFGRMLAPGGSLFLLAGSSANSLHGLRDLLEGAGFSVESISPCGGIFWFLGMLFKKIPDYIFHQYLFINQKRSIRWSARTILLIPLHAASSWAVLLPCAVFFFLDRFDVRRDVTLGYSCHATKIRP